MSPVATSDRTVDAVRRFSQLSRDDVPYAGGKGANLGELTAAGVPVPPGFVVGAPSYAAFCEEGALRQQLTLALDGVDVEDTGALEAAAAKAGARPTACEAAQLLPAGAGMAILRTWRARKVARSQP